MIPAIFINNNLVKENLEIDLTVSAICDKFEDAPDICLEFQEIDLFDTSV